MANKKDKKPKPVYRDVPRYPLIYKYEGGMKRDYVGTIDDMVSDLKKKLKEIVNGI